MSFVKKLLSERIKIQRYINLSTDLAAAINFLMEAEAICLFAVCDEENYERVGEELTCPTSDLEDDEDILNISLPTADSISV